MILNRVWNSSFEDLTNVVDVYISALRSKVDGDFPQKMIKTNRDIGYTFTRMSSIPPTPNGPHQLIAYPKHQGGLSSQVLTPL
jgi:DNA-binding winged helix-turn-helix (wHTH) protein